MSALQPLSVGRRTHCGHVATAVFDPQQTSTEFSVSTRITAICRDRAPERGRSDRTAPLSPPPAARAAPGVPRGDLGVSGDATAGSITEQGPGQVSRFPVDPVGSAHGEASVRPERFCGRRAGMSG